MEEKARGGVKTCITRIVRLKPILRRLYNSALDPSKTGIWPRIHARNFNDTGMNLLIIVKTFMLDQ